MRRPSIEFQDKLYRAKNRLENTILPRRIGRRSHSFPFLSSDEYALSVDVSIDRADSDRDIERRLRQPLNSKTLFLPSSRAQIVSDILWNRSDLPRKIVLGDDDIQWKSSSLHKLFPRIREIFAVNLLDEGEVVRGIPLGLESSSYRSGGRITDFKRVPNLSYRKRKYQFLIAWNRDTNANVRDVALAAFLNRQNSFIASKRYSPQVIHKLMRSSLFVVCPSGNGIDTHRIWEALYLGAVPVVREREYFPALQGWPIWIVKDWNEALFENLNEAKLWYESFVPSLHIVRDNSVKLLRSVCQ